MNIQTLKAAEEDGRKSQKAIADLDASKEELLADQAVFVKE
jgi:hypothetical protein